METSLLKHTNPKKLLSLFLGIGQNVGYTYDGTISINYENSGTVIEKQGEGSDSPVVYERIGDIRIQEDYKLRNGVSQRLFLHTGIGIRFFKRIQLAYELRYGFGYRATFNTPLKMTQLKSSAVALRWLFNQKNKT